MSTQLIKIFWILFAVIINICSVTSSYAIPTSPRPEKNTIIPETMLSEQRKDIRAVIHALVYKLQGAKESGIGPVVFNDNFSNFTDGTDLNYREFRVSKILITKDYHPQDNKKYRAFSAVFEFTDPGLRVAMVQISATYYLGSELIFLEKAEATPVFPSFFDVNLYFVPSQVLPDLKEIKKMAYPELIEFIEANGIMPEELNKIKPGKMTRLAIFAISSKRYEQSSALSFHVAGDNDESLAIAQSTLSFNLSGWPITMVKGLFILNNSPGFELQTGLTRNIEGEKKELLVNRFFSVDSLNHD